MAPSRTRCLGREVHTDSIAVASVAPESGAEVSYLGTIGTRPCASDQLVRTMPSQAQRCHRASAEPQPRVGWHPRRRAETLRASSGQREAGPDGGKEGGQHPPAIRRSTRRCFLAPPLLRLEGKKTMQT
jgi:hypothetical protein